jgi:hypothetical protein
MFPAREGGRWEQRNALRSYYCLLKRQGFTTIAAVLEARC